MKTKMERIEFEMCYDCPFLEDKSLAMDVGEILVFKQKKYRCRYYKEWVSPSVWATMRKAEYCLLKGVIILKEG